jgi:hypothetical protein
LSNDFQTGWVRVSGTAEITGFASYADEESTVVLSTYDRQMMFLCMESSSSIHKI